MAGDQGAFGSVVRARRESGPVKAGHLIAQPVCSSRPVSLSPGIPHTVASSHSSTSARAGSKPEMKFSSTVRRARPGRSRSSSPSRSRHVSPTPAARRNIDFVRSLGADEVLDYTHVDAPPSGVRYAFVLDSVGRLKSLRLKDACRRALAPGGYVSIDDGDLELNSKRLGQLTGLIESGTVSPIVGAVYSQLRGCCGGGSRCLASP